MTKKARNIFIGIILGLSIITVLTTSALVFIFVKSGAEASKDETEEKESEKSEFSFDYKENTEGSHGDDKDSNENLLREENPEDRDALDYSDEDNWAYLADDSSEVEDVGVDVFYVCPSFYNPPETDIYSIDLDDEDQLEGFKNTVGLQKGIYDDKARFYAPYYRQASLNVYYADRADLDTREEFLAAGYRDIKDAFDYYMENYNDGRGVVLAGFSQGSDMLKRLMMDEDFPLAENDIFIAAYLIGWNIQEEDLKPLEDNGIYMAEEELDTQCIISFCSESKDINGTVMVPEGVYTYGINPLNWMTDGTDGVDTVGICWDLSGDGTINQETTWEIGAYRDMERGTLKVTRVSADRFAPDLPFCPPGDFHVWDYRFFYRPLEENVQKRIGKWLDKSEEELASFCVKTESKKLELQADFEKNVESPKVSPPDSVPGGSDVTNGPGTEPVQQPADGQSPEAPEYNSNPEPALQVEPVPQQENVVTPEPPQPPANNGMTPEQTQIQQQQEQEVLEQRQRDEEERRRLEEEDRQRNGQQ